MFFKKEVVFSALNTNQVTNMSYMFYDCSSLNYCSIESFNTEKVKDMSYMFYNCSSKRYL